MKKHRWAAAAAALCCLLGSCAALPAETAAPAAAAPSERETLRILLRGSAVNTEAVAEEFSRRAGSRLGFDIRIEGVRESAYDDTVAMMLQGGAPPDIVVEMPTDDFFARARQGVYLRLDMQADFAPLRGALNADFLRANSINGAVYGVPAASSFIDAGGVYYRSDFLLPYGMPFREIRSPAQLERYLRTLRESIVSLTPLACGAQGIAPLYLQQPPAPHIYAIPTVSGGKLPAAAVLSADGRTVRAVLFAGDAPALFTPYCRSGDFLTDAYTSAAALAPYMPRDALLSSRFAAPQLTLGKAAALAAACETEPNELQRALHFTDINADLAYYPFGQCADGAAATGMRADYLLCLPAQSGKHAQALAFLQWLYGSSENMQLLALGVEGRDWRRGEESGTYTALTNPNGSYAVPRGQFAYPPYLLRPAGTAEPSLPQEPAAYRVNPMAGYVPQMDGCPAEWALVCSVYGEEMCKLSFGLYGENTAEQLRRLHAQAEALGLETVRAALMQELQAYLSSAPPA